MSEYYCPAPWTGGHFTVEKQSVCCAHIGLQNVSPKEFINSNHVRELKQRLLTGDLDTSCSKCREDDANGFISLRQNLEFMQKTAHIDFVKDLEAKTIPKAIEVKISNLCNFKCRICTPAYSNSIDKEYKENPEILSKYYYVFLQQKEIGHQTANDKFINEIIEFLPNLRWLNTTGGEPMLAPDFFKLIEAAKEQDHAKHIGLHVTTNCSTINPKFINSINDFERIHFSLSIDGIDAVAEYSRHGTKWSIVSKNIAYYCELMQQNNRITINTTTAISAYTVLEIDKLTKYILDLHYKYGMHVSYNIVSGYLHPTVLVGDMRDKAKLSIDNAIQLVDNIEIFNEARTQLISLRRMLDGDENLEDYNKFVAFTQELDRLRNESFEQVFGYQLT